MDRLRAEHITKSFDGTTIIQDVSLTLHEDELICLLGVSGVGKSTFFNVLSGLGRAGQRPGSVGRGGYYRPNGPH